MTQTDTSVFETEDMRIQKLIDSKDSIDFIRQADLPKLKRLIADYRSKKYLTLELLGEEYKVSRTQISVILIALGVYTARKSPNKETAVTVSTESKQDMFNRLKLAMLMEHGITSLGQLENILLNIQTMCNSYTGSEGKLY